MTTELICYCFKYSKKDILTDLKENGKSRILEKILKEKQNNACNCALENPKGT